jgi:hypothetical protein
MQSFNFFLIATAFLFAAYGSLLRDHPVVAMLIGVIGAWISIWFNRLERRTKQLVKAGEAALRPLQTRLVEETGIATLAILDRVEMKAPGSSSYSRVINLIQWTIVFGFAAGALYAATQILNRPGRLFPW